MPTHANTTARLLPGETVQLQGNGPESIRLLLPTTGEYTLQTSGDTDTYCKLYDQRSGLIAKDDNSGKSRNCRINTRLEAGAYKLAIRKGKRPVSVLLTAYKAQGAVEDITEGATINDSLFDGKYRTFRIRIKRRRWLKISASSQTLSHCRLITPSGWLVPLTYNRTHRLRYRRRYRRHRRRSSNYRARCTLQGIVEPGTYLLRTYGRTDLASGKTQASLAVEYGLKKLRPSRWKVVRLQQKQRTKNFWFQLPKARKLARSEQTLVVEIFQQAGSYSSWRAGIFHHPWTAASGRKLANCWGSSRRRFCTVTRKVRSGQRFSISLYSYRGHTLRLRYFTFRHAESLALGKPAQQLALAGQASQIDFRVNKAGRYWVQIKPKAENCYLTRTDRPVHKRLHTAKGRKIPNGKTSYTIVTTSRKGYALLFQVTQAGQVHWETTGRIDTYCTLSDWQGNKLASNDDGGPGRNCRIQRYLQPGVYKFFLRIFRGPTIAPIKLITQHKPRNQRAPIVKSNITTGCAFHATLQPGPYRLFVQAPIKTASRLFYVVSSAAKRKLYQPRSKANFSSDILRPQRPTRVFGARWQRWFRTSKLQWTTFNWRVARAGHYHVTSLGHLRFRCALASQRGNLTQAQGNRQHGNCNMTTYLTPGLYRIHAQAIGNTEGNAGFQAIRLRPKRLSIRPGRRSFSMLPPYHVGIAKLPTKRDKNNVHAMSLDANILCRWGQKDDWPSQVGTCTHKANENSGQLWVYNREPSRATRIRLLHAPTTQWKQQHPTRTVTLGRRSDPQKPIALVLNQHINGWLSILGWDAYTFSLKRRTTLSMALGNNVHGRLSRGKTTVTTLTSAKSSFVKTLTLAPGRYRLLIRHRKGLTGHRYKLRVNVKQTEPNASFWSPTPAKIAFRIQKAAVVDLSTQGDIDTWCSLEDNKGRELAKNDNAVPHRWDCHIARRLQPGLYNLRIGSNDTKGGTWVSIRTRYERERQATLAASKRHRWLGRRYVHTFAYKLAHKGTKLVTWTAQSRKGRQLHCTLLQNGKTIQTSQGQRCKVSYPANAGTYHWQLYSQHRRTLAYVKNASQQDIQTAVRARAASVVTDGRGRAHIAVQIETAGTYTFQWGGLQQDSNMRCRLTTQRRDIDCQKPIALTAGTHLLTIQRKPSQKALSLTLTDTPLSAGQSHSISLPVDQLFQSPIQIASEGWYALSITGKDNRRWGCQWQQHTTRSKGNRCELVQYLTKGSHPFRLWRPRGQAGDNLPVTATVKVRALDALKARALPGNTHVIERRFKPGMQALWQLPKGDILEGQLVLHGSGIAVVSRGKHVLKVCHAGSAHHCQWQARRSKLPLTLRVVASPSKALHIRASWQEVPALVPGGTLHIGQIEALSAKAGLIQAFTLTSKTPTNALVEVMGQGRCTLFHNGPKYTTGCRQTLQLSTQPKQLVVRMQGAGFVTLYKAGQRASSLWGAARPPKDAAPGLRPGGKLHFTALKTDKGGAFLWRKLKVSGGPIVIRAAGNQLACALFDNKGRLLLANAGQSACTLERPLAKGTYWLGVRSLNGLPQRCTLRAQMAITLALTQGRHGPYLLGPGESRWFTFKALRKGTFGIAAVDQHDAIDCQLYDAKLQHVGTGCQRYHKGPAGLYRLRVSLKPKRKAAAMNVVLRGLNPPPAKPPRSFIEKIKRNQSN